MSRVGLLVCIAFLLWGCIPSDVPPQLAFTPGAPFTLYENRYESAFLSADVPNGWRVISPPSESPESVIFVSPENTTLIQLSTREITSPPLLQNLLETQQASQTLSRDGLFGVVVYERRLEAQALPLLESVLENASLK